MNFFKSLFNDFIDSVVSRVKHSADEVPTGRRGKPKPKKVSPKKAKRPSPVTGGAGRLVQRIKQSARMRAYHKAHKEEYKTRGRETMKKHGEDIRSKNPFTGRKKGAKGRKPRKDKGVKRKTKVESTTGESVDQQDYIFESAATLENVLNKLRNNPKNGAVADRIYNEITKALSEYGMQVVNDALSKCDSDTLNRALNYPSKQEANTAMIVYLEQFYEEIHHESYLNSLTNDELSDMYEDEIGWNHEEIESLLEDADYEIIDDNMEF